RDRERVVGLAHALVGRNRDAAKLYPAAQRSELSNSGTRLLNVLEVELCERVDRALCLVETPRPVGIETDASLSSQILAHRPHARDIISTGLPPLSDLHLHGAAGAE